MTRRSDSGDRYVMLALDLSQDEIACRFLEEFANLDRPPNKTATQALEEVEPEVSRMARRAAASVMVYLRRQINDGIIHDSEKRT